MRTAFLLLLTCPAVFADFNSALRDYEAKQYDKALVEFRRLAELGGAESQRNLAAMYARGEAVTKDLVEAYAWASLSADQDKETAEPLRQLLAQQLDTVQLTNAELRSQQLRLQFGQPVLAKTLFPIAAEQAADCSVEVSGNAKAISTPVPRYPVAALREGFGATLRVRFYLDATGAPARSRIDFLETNGKANGSVRKSLVQALENAMVAWRFHPAKTEALREIPLQIQVRFSVLSEAKNDELQDMLTSLSESMDQLESSDASAQYAAAAAIDSKLTGISVTATSVRRTSAESSRENADSLFMNDAARRAQLSRVAAYFFQKSAANGDPDGQFWLAKKLLTGDHCEKDVQKGITWLAFAAQQGQPDAQYLLALSLASGDGVLADQAKALHWLRAAAQSGHERARIQYAMHLLKQGSTPIAEVLAFLPEFSDDDNIGQLEIQALVAAMQGQRQLAIQLQEKVLSIASELGFAQQRRQHWLASFRKGEIPDLHADS